MKFYRMQNLIAVALVALIVAGATPAIAKAGKPNIVFVLMDNLGYGEVGVYGGGILRGAATPRIDKLAAEGTRLLNFNVESQCTPSRSAIMTCRCSKLYLAKKTSAGSLWRQQFSSLHVGEG